MGAAQAKEYGLIDDVLPPRKKGEGSDRSGTAEREAPSPATGQRQAPAARVSASLRRPRGGSKLSASAVEAGV